MDANWLDVVGDQLEASGVDPGRIFEFHSALGDGALPGGIVVTNQRLPPGEVPKTPWDVAKVIIRLKDGSEVSKGSNWPLFLTRFYHLQPELS